VPKPLCAAPPPTASPEAESGRNAAALFLVTITAYTTILVVGALNGWVT